MHHLYLWLQMLTLGFLFAKAQIGAGATTNLLVPSGSSWKYLDDGSDQGTAWREMSFDDAAWSSGPAQFGFGDSDERTVLRFGTNAARKYITYYFRHSFQVTNALMFTGVLLRVLRDDGAVVYLNGAEVFRGNMPAGPINYLTRAVANVADGAERTFQPRNLSASVLRAGTNFLAVEVHQESPASGDLSFDLQLAGVRRLPVITRGPYLQQGGATNMTVRWRTDVATDSGVRFGTSHEMQDSSVSDATLTTEHEVEVTGLTAGTKYFYMIGTYHVPVTADESHFFVTAPTNAAPTRVWVIGDSGTKDERPRSVYAAYTNFTATRHTDVWLMLGDNAYDSGTDAQYQTAVFAMFPEMLRRTVAWSTIGNHDTYSGSSADFPLLRIFTLPTQGECGGVPSGTERYFSFDHANIHFVCLDAMTSDRTTNGPMLRWLQHDLAANARDWLIAFWHHPPYSKGSHDSDRERELIQMRENAVPILESFGVDLVLCGHSHCYERSFFIQGHYGRSGTFDDGLKVLPGSGREDDTGAYRKALTGATANQGTVYVVAGSSGHATFGSLDHPAMYFGELKLGSLVLDIDGPVLEAKFLRETGAIDDYFTIVKGMTEAPRIVSFTQNGAALTLTWNSQPGKRYRVEDATELNSPNWNPASEILQASGSHLDWTTPLVPGASHIFYRVSNVAD